MNTSRFLSFARRFRFSLRVLLVATTICCIVVGMLAERWRRVSVAVSRIQKAGGHITYDYERHIGFMHGEEFERAVEESRRYHWLRNIVFFPERLAIHGENSSSELTDILREGAQIGTIQDVNFFSGNFSDEHAELLSRFPKLRTFSVHSEALTPRGAARLLKQPGLMRAEIQGCRNVDDSVLNELSGHIPLKCTLYCDNTGISETVEQRLIANP